MSDPRLSIIIPTLNEAEGIVATLQPLQALRRRGHEVILADGGSTDTTIPLAGPWVDQVVRSNRGRALQMNAGAEAAHGQILLFLHADTQLPPDTDHMLLEALETRHWGRFDVRLSGTRSGLRVIEWLMNWRSRLSGIATGDQAIFVRRDTFRKVGGFPAIALMEDIALSRALKKRGRPRCLRARVTTSSRRWEQHGLMRTVLLMWRLRLAYWLGADPARLAKQYQPMQFSDAVILVFAKAPIIGEVKTRLIPAIGAAAAAGLHARLVRHTLATATQADICPVQLWCAPDTAHAFFTECQRDFGVTLHAQQGGDLGARMAHAFDTALRQYRQAVIIGSDCPLLTAQDIVTTLAALRADCDAVLGPAQDGGYVLLGLKHAPPALFANIPWGTANVLALTRERLQQLQWRVTELAAHWDADRPEDLAHPFMRKLLLESKE